MSAGSQNSSWQSYFTPLVKSGAKVAGIGTATYFAWNNFGNLKSADFDLVPMNSVLHGIHHSSLPFNHIKVKEISYNIEDFINKQTDDSTTTLDANDIKLLTGQVFTGDTSANAALNKYYTSVDGDPWFMDEFDETKNEAYIHYAMGCVEWKDTATSIGSVTVDNVGSGYTAGTFDATVSCTGDCTGTGLVAKCIVADDTATVSEVTVLHGGSGYSASTGLPTITCEQTGASTATFTANLDSGQKLVMSHHKTDACKCVTDHFTAWTTAAASSETTKPWPVSAYTEKDTSNKKAYELDVIKQCSRRNPNKYNVEYAGAVNSEHIMQAGQGFLLAALVMMLVNSFEEESNTPVKKFMVAGGVFLSALVIGVTLGVYEDLKEGVWIAQVEDDSKLLTKRDFMGTTVPGDFYTTGNAGEGTALEDQSSMTKTMLRWFTYGAVLVWGLLSLLLIYCEFSTKHNSASILFRFVIDVPVIMGLTLTGVSVLIQNGYTNYNYLDLNIFLILCICFMQHMSNVIKMFYDAVCRNTKSEVFEMLYFHKQNDAQKVYIEDIADEQTKKFVNSPEKQDSKTNHVTNVLQFFGWFRVWIFLLVTLGTVLFLTMTNELVKTTSVGNVFSSQVLVFALVLYLTNVGYDVVRELLPVEFQQYETDHTRFWILTLYLIFYNINQHSYSEHFLGSANK